MAISYLFGCGGHAACAVVDPVGDIEPYFRVADETGMRIRFVVDTHIHADHRSACRALASASGAEYVLHATAELSFSSHLAKHGDRLPLGNVVVDVLQTPGHTPEHVCLLVTDRTRADEPWFVLTGHALMIGDVGRTELAEDAASGDKRRIFDEIMRVLKPGGRLQLAHIATGKAVRCDPQHRPLDRLNCRWPAVRRLAANIGRKRLRPNRNRPSR